MSYRIAVFEAPAEGEDTLVAELWGRGARGFEVKGGTQAEEGCEESVPRSGKRGSEPLRIEAYFEAESVAAFPAGADLERWRAAGIRFLGLRELEERDWLEEYRATAEPFEVGRRLVVDPRDVPPPSAPPTAERAAGRGRIRLSIPAQNAFGTGSHESTRLALEWLEELPIAGRRVLDVGCGSGILSFAAERLGAGWVTGFDLDPPSVITARSNACRNGCSPRLLAATAEAFGSAGRPFDLLLVNVLPERVLRHYPRLLSLLKRGGSVVSSGNLGEKRTELLGRFAQLGLDLAGEKRQGEWTSFHLRSVPRRTADRREPAS